MLGWNDVIPVIIGVEIKTNITSLHLWFSFSDTLVYMQSELDIHQTFNWHPVDHTNMSCTVIVDRLSTGTLVQITNLQSAVCFKKPQLTDNMQR